jgi:hypothetical protein
MVSPIDLGFETDGVKPMIIKLEIAASPPSTGWLGISILCRKGGAVG